MGSQEEIKIENDFILLRFQNDGNENYHVKRHHRHRAPVTQWI